MAKGKQITFTISGQMLKQIEELKETFEVETTAAVLRRALALARVAAEHARDDHTLEIVTKDNKHRNILLNG